MGKRVALLCAIACAIGIGAPQPASAVVPTVLIGTFDIDGDNASHPEYSLSLQGTHNGMPASGAWKCRYESAPDTGILSSRCVASRAVVGMPASFYLPDHPSPVFGPTIQLVPCEPTGFGYSVAGQLWSVPIFDDLVLTVEGVDREESTQYEFDCASEYTFRGIAHTVG